MPGIMKPEEVAVARQPLDKHIPLATSTCSIRRTARQGVLFVLPDRKV
jgi:hypothetical protein